MKGNTTNHPSRAGISIKPSKGGRTKRHTFSMTIETWERIQVKAKAKGISLNDWLDEKAKE